MPNSDHKRHDDNKDNVLLVRDIHD